MAGYEYHPDAEAEYLEAVRYYSQINPELGISLVIETEKAIDRARQFPEAYGKIFGEYRHVMTHVFHF